MKKLIIFILIFALSSCSFSKTDKLSKTPPVSQNQVITNNEKSQIAKKNDNFEKNLKCAELIDKVKEREINHAIENPRWKASIQEIFYSPKTNSCLYITHVESLIQAYTLKTLMDVSQEIGTNPVEDLSCEFISDEFKYQELLKDIKKMYGEKEAERIINKNQYACKLFNETIINEYK